jgi:hypothetical protein
MEVDIDEGWRDQMPGGIDHTSGLSRQIGLHRNDTAPFNGDILARAAVGKRDVANEEVERHETLAVAGVIAELSALRCSNARRSTRRHPPVRADRFDLYQ